jgi:2-C-methyl-D-erythritol 4-phosphate cytidylyltransferase
MAVIATIITAAGASSRMGGIKKEYRPLGNGALDGEGKPLTVLGAAVSAFAAVERISTVIIAVSDAASARSSLPARLFLPEATPRLDFAAGGPTRRASVYNALTLLASYHPDYVLIHDGARPWVDTDLIERIIDAVLLHNAVIPILPITETPKEIDAFPEQDGTGLIKRHLRRAQVGTAQTPQAFAFPAILAAHEKAAERERIERIEYTDDAEVWGEFCGPVAVIPGSSENRKITFPEDLAL